MGSLRKKLFMLSHRYEQFVKENLHYRCDAVLEFLRTWLLRTLSLDHPCGVHGSSAHLAYQELQAKLGFLVIKVRLFAIKGYFWPSKCPLKHIQSATVAPVVCLWTTDLATYANRLSMQVEHRLPGGKCSIWQAARNSHAEQVWPEWHHPLWWLTFVNWSWWCYKG